MITGEVREDPPTEVHSSDTMLRHSVGADFHKDVRAPSLMHPPKEGLQLGSRRGRVRSRDGFILDVVAHRTQQATAIACGTEDPEEQGRNGRLPIGTCDSDDLHRLRGMTV